MTLSLPKPVRRGPKPCRRIARHIRPRRQLKTPLAKLKRQADALWTATVLRRDNYTCRNCGKHVEQLAREDISLQGAHGFRRRTYGRVRWDLVNGFALCERCHQRFSFRETEWGLWLVNVLGKDRMEELLETSRDHVKINRVFLEGKMAALRAEMETLRAADERRLA